MEGRTDRWTDGGMDGWVAGWWVGGQTGRTKQVDKVGGQRRVTGG